MMDAYEKFFTEADTDGDGNLSVTELTSALRQHGYKGTDKQILVGALLAWYNIRKAKL